MIKALLLYLGLLLLVPHHPLVAAVTYICGFELGSVGTGTRNVVEGADNQTAVVAQTSIKRTGVYALRINPVAADTGWLWLRSLGPGGTPRVFSRSWRFYAYFTSLPAANDYSMAGGVGAGLQINTSGALRISADGLATFSSYSGSVLSTNTWYRIEIDGGWNAGTGAKVYVDGVEFASISTGAAAASDTLQFGPAAVSTVDWYVDDVLVDDAAFNGTLPGAGQAIILKPISDNNRGTWTGGVGGTTNLWEALNNIPPDGTASETDTTQIENATNTADQDGLFNCESYTTGGVGASDTINAVMAIVNDGEDAAAGTKTGGVWINSNPAQAAGGLDFDFGNDAGALDAVPTGWRTHVGPVAALPSVTLGTSPVVGIRAISATTSVRSVDFLGVYVDYTPAAVPPPAGTSTGGVRSKPRKSRR